jgi:drug/metabolite transporter (DMT)-like permease
VGAIFETIGQLFYIYALASGESALAAPIISSYCVASVLWSRIFLKEKLSWKHYACIVTTIVGIIIMGVYDM